jgi:hypothetical protein
MERSIRYLIFPTFGLNDVTLKKVLKIANRKFHNLFRFCKGNHGKTIALPTNERNTQQEKEYPNLFAVGNLREMTNLQTDEHLYYLNLYAQKIVPYVRAAVRSDLLGSMAGIEHTDA